MDKAQHPLDGSRGADPSRGAVRPEPPRSRRRRIADPRTIMTLPDGSIDFGRRLMPGDRVLVGRVAFQTSMLEIRDPCADIHPVIGTVERTQDSDDGSLEVSVRIDCDGKVRDFDAAELLPFE
jgi:hypothetical protein